MNLLRNPKLLIPLALLGVVIIAAAILLLSRQSQNQRPSLPPGLPPSRYPLPARHRLP
ncbi:MAG: hypothetical protein IPL78_02955 [Chloroflexi bacterium]|nr:hypothetical protein [Chloroflexota bacterium]